ncbi:allantoate amidohydrolase [Paenibacillus sp. BIHB 4019]|uniref:Allantoate amidohydrolase n=1 Tax=Paenibacillus sp. BIHB 4019 TaxID=1870819 RepID=A0A1B2DPB1_9BACL|nr:allantoate deiminase [Paenibacillus sp. BIHB 4019]ANY69544.1 allantoate amidohydrolase [Paenibacillus sp. BIHB 4019]
MTMASKWQLASFVPKLLEELSQFGADPRGGVTRLLYTAEWLEAQQYLAEQMQELGMDVYFDRVGNLFGRLQGSSEEGPVIMTGSHIDTVQSGGIYDGAYGVAAGIAALAHLKETYGQPVKTLEVVSLCEEEGSRFPLTYWGSGNMTGLYDLEQCAERYDAAGTSLQEAMLHCGFGKAEQRAARRSDIAAFVELHIEQGPVLERQQLSVGIVEAIVGQHRYTVTVGGTANHAGTTPMPLRRDALAGAAAMIVQLETEAILTGSPLVATVGKLAATPNTPNVIAGSVSFTVDVRHIDGTAIREFCQTVFQQFQEIAGERELRVTIEQWMEAAPAPMDGQLRVRLERIAKQLTLPYTVMPSGAGHDAQLLSGICPTAMLFVPSRGGISHSPEEYTSPDQLAAGAEMLSALLYELAYEEK